MAFLKNIQSLCNGSDTTLYIDSHEDAIRKKNALLPISQRSKWRLREFESCVASLSQEPM